MGGPEGVDEMLWDVARRVGKSTNYVVQLGEKMPCEHFSAEGGFRFFLNPHPRRLGLIGPSGQFTAAIPVIDILLGGENLPRQMIDYYNERLLYFPLAGRVAMEDAWKIVGLVGSLTSLVKGRAADPKVTAAVNEVIKQMEGFRLAHYKAVAQQVPGSLRGDVSGTSGEGNVAKFLKERMRVNYWG